MLEGTGELPWAAKGDEVSRVAIADDLERSARRGCHDRAAGCSGLEDGVRQAFCIGRLGNDIEGR